MLYLKTPLNHTQDLQHPQSKILISIALYREIFEWFMRSLLYSFLFQATWHLSCALCVTSSSRKLTGMFRASWMSICFATDQRYSRPGGTKRHRFRRLFF